MLFYARLWETVSADFFQTADSLSASITRTVDGYEKAVRRGTKGACGVHRNGTFPVAPLQRTRMHSRKLTSGLSFDPRHALDGGPLVKRISSVRRKL
jgi:hypothetical protein